MLTYEIKKKWIDYGEWLIWRVKFDLDGYDKLMELLHDIPFIYFINGDENRAIDGKMLREEYLSEDMRSIDLFDVNYEECSILELLVGLSIRIDNEWIGEIDEEHPNEIFWEMLENLGLNRSTDSSFNSEFVLKTIDIWINRKFDRNGIGSIFPLMSGRRDQRRLEIWEQMQEYISENY